MPLRFVLGAALIMGALVAASVVTYFNNQVAYYTIDELVASPEIYPLAPGSGVALAAEDSGEVPRPFGRRVQVRGSVQKQSVKRAQEGLLLQFTLTGKNGQVPVSYRGVVPDTFDLAETITVAGQVTSDGRFEADQLFVQCPSKYEAKPPGSEAVGSPMP